MYPVCKAFSHYGRVDPEDKWLPEFQCYDGLNVQWVAEENCNQLQKAGEGKCNQLQFEWQSKGGAR